MKFILKSINKVLKFSLSISFLLKLSFSKILTVLSVTKYDMPFDTCPSSQKKSKTISLDIK